MKLPLSLWTNETVWAKKWPKWLAYIAGVAFELQNRGINLSGADLMISSDVPLGAGCLHLQR
jgi:galactokinase